MKKHIITIGKWMLSVACATGMACGAICADASDTAVLAVFVCGGVLIALVLGLFDIKDSSIYRHMSIKNGARSVRRAA